MPHPEELSQWQAEIASGLPVLSEAQACVLAQWCFAMEQTTQGGSTTLAVFLGLALGCAWQTVRQRLREFYFDAEDKCGLGRRELAVQGCFVPLARWVLAHWPGTRLALALDATTLADKLVILTVSVLYKGCAVPIAWKVLPAGKKHPWKGEWLTLLTLVKPAVPADWQVLVLTDRGLYARWLFAAIVGHHWHPCMRINKQGTFHATGAHQRQRLTAFVPRPGTGWEGRVSPSPAPNAAWPARCSPAGNQAIRTPGASSPTSHPRTAISRGMVSETGLRSASCMTPIPRNSGTWHREWSPFLHPS